MRKGPDGWRGTIADGVTVDRVRRLAAGYGAVVAADRAAAARGVVVGHDTRFGGERFAGAAAQSLLARGVPVLLLAGALPAPAVAHAVGSGRRAGGFYVTGGDLPAEDSGVSLYEAGGAPASAPLLAQVEEHAAAASPTDAGARGSRRRAAAVIVVKRHPAAGEGYLKSLLRAVPAARLKRGRLHLAADSRHGAASGWLEAALRRRASVVETVNEQPRPDFGGKTPTCGDLDLKELGRTVRQSRSVLGASTDADGTHCGLVDERGLPIPPGALAALLADRLIADGRARGGLARSVAATHLIDDIAAAHGRPLIEVPFGPAALAAALGREAGLGIDESGGIAFAPHARERDGILLALLAAEATAVAKRPLRDQISDLMRRLGTRVGRRIDYHVDPAARDRALARLEEVPSRFAGRPVRAVAASESRKWILADGSWVLFRAGADGSPLRCHLEARSLRDLEAMTAAARDWMTRP
jgi:phosphoglucomutase